jgi:hypothetical protein
MCEEMRDCKAGLNEAFDVAINIAGPIELAVLAFVTTSMSRERSKKRCLQET